MSPITSTELVKQIRQASYGSKRALWQAAWHHNATCNNWLLWVRLISLSYPLGWYTC